MIVSKRKHVLNTPMPSPVGSCKDQCVCPKAAVDTGTEGMLRASAMTLCGMQPDVRSAEGQREKRWLGLMGEGKGFSENEPVHPGSERQVVVTSGIAGGSTR